MSLFEPQISRSRPDYIKINKAFANVLCCAYLKRGKFRPITPLLLLDEIDFSMPLVNNLIDMQFKTNNNFFLDSSVRGKYKTTFNLCYKRLKTKANKYPFCVKYL